MPGGRPTGSRNTRDHGAGGQRPGAGRKSKEDEVQLEEENRAKRQKMEEQHGIAEAGRMADGSTMLQQREERTDQAERDAVAALQSQPHEAPVVHTHVPPIVDPSQKKSVAVQTILTVDPSQKKSVAVQTILTVDPSQKKSVAVQSLPIVDPTQNKNVVVQTIPIVDPSQKKSVALQTIPLVDPSQKKSVPIQTTTSERRCAWWPFCSKRINICGGSKRHRCKFREDFKNVSDKELEEAKKEARNEIKRIRAQQKQAEKVAARERRRSSSKNNLNTV